MGLDICAYENLKVKKVLEDEAETGFYNNGFAQCNMCEIEYDYLEINFTDCYDFRAGSYGGYNKFRNELCNIANNINDEQLWKSKDESLKFYWLINFSDCEGYIGTSYCKILYKQFCDYEKDIIPYLSNNHALIYGHFKKAFKIGANNGVVKFY